MDNDDHDDEHPILEYLRMAAAHEQAHRDLGPEHEDENFMDFLRMNNDRARRARLRLIMRRNRRQRPPEDRERDANQPPPPPQPPTSPPPLPPASPVPSEPTRSSAAQCLILVVSEGKGPTPRLEGYVLFAQKDQVAFPRICGLFHSNGLRMIDNNTAYPTLETAVKNHVAEAVEMLVTEGPVVTDGPAEPRAFIENFNRRTIDNLIDRNDIVQYEAELCFNEIRSAVDEANSEVVKKLLGLDADINHKHPKGGTLLHLAVNRGNESLVRLLLSKGADVNATRTDDSTAMHLAAHKGFEDIFQVLLSGGGCVDASMKGSKAGATPLHLAAAHGHISIVEKLVQHGASIDAAAFSDTGLGGATPLHVAVEKKHGEIVELLLEKGANVNAKAFFEKTALLLAVEEGLPRIVEYILEHRPDINDSSNARAFRLALVQPGPTYQEIAGLLSKHGFTVGPEDVHDKELLHGAIRKNQLDVVRMLLYHGAGANEMYGDGFSGLMPLHTAAQHAKEDILRLLFRHGAFVDARSGQGTTPIYDAVQAKNLIAVQVFLEKNASIWDIPDYLLTACEIGHTTIVRMLLKRGADANVQNDRGKSPLFIAVNNPQIVKDLLKYGAKVDGTSHKSRTALHEACLSGCPEVVEILLRNGADIEAKCENNRTPIFYAAESWNFDIIKILGKFNARIDIRDKEQKTILHLNPHSRTTPNPVRCLKAVLKYHLTSPFLVSFIQERQKIFKGISSFMSYCSHRGNAEERMHREMHERTMAYTAYRDFFHNIERHAFKMKAANLFFLDSDLRNMMPGPDGYMEECKAEIEKMKTEKIGESFVSYYDVLTHPENLVARYARNEEIVQIINSEGIQDKFPIYGENLVCQFERGVLRKEMLAESVQMCEWLFRRFVPLPDDVKERILCHLSNRDLGTLMYTGRLRRFS